MNPTEQYLSVNEATQAVESEVVQQLGRTNIFSFISTLLLALIVITIAREHVSNLVLSLWLAALCCVFAVRFWLKAIAANRPRTYSSKALLYCRITIGSTGSIWALGELAILYSGREHFIYEDYIFFTLVSVGYLVGAMLALAVDKPTMVLCSGPSFFPVFVAFTSMGESTAFSSGAALTLFVLYVYAAALNQNKKIQENVVLRLRATESEEQFKSILNTSPIAACISSIDSDEIMFTNDRYRELLVGNKSFNRALQSILNLETFQTISNELKNGNPVTNKLIELTHTKMGSNWLLGSFNPFLFNGKPCVLSWYYDITDRKKLEEQITEFAYQDHLTGLPNRILFNDRLEHALEVSKRDKNKVALLYIDLDHFKPINDMHGHLVGDEILVQAAERMRKQVRKSDMIARLGGDEFGSVLLIEENANAKKIAENIRAAIEKEFSINDTTHKISVSIGISFYPEHATDGDHLMNMADQAMYQAKQQGRNSCVIYSPQQMLKLPNNEPDTRS